MSLSAHLIEQLKAEVDASRRVIERIPESALEWSPHEKSWNTRELATHVANLISWGMMILTTEGLDFEDEEMQNWSPPKPESAAGIVELLAENGSKVEGILGGMSDEDLAVPWVMRSGDHVIASDSRLYAFTRWVLSHQSHHRGELMVYLRLNDVPLPGIFGPTADEQEM